MTFLDRDNELRVEARVTDEAGNYTMTASTFSLDGTPPTSLITFPASSGLTVSSMTSIIGTAQDITSALNEVRIKMWYLSGGVTYYWNPDLSQPPFWETSDPGFAAIANSNGPKATPKVWQYNSSHFTNPTQLTYAWRQATHDSAAGPNFGNGKLFNIITQANDSTGNDEVIFTTRTFLFDNQPPTSAPTAPTDGRL